MHVGLPTCVFFFFFFAFTWRALYVIAPSPKRLQGFFIYFFSFSARTARVLFAVVCLHPCVPALTFGRSMRNWIIEYVISLFMTPPLQKKKKNPPGSCHSADFIQISATLPFYLAHRAWRFIYRSAFKESGFSLMRRSPRRRRLMIYFCCSSTWDSRAW